MNSKIICSLALLCLSVTGKAQSFSAFKKSGDQALAEKDFYAAMHYYGNALELRPDDPVIQYQFAEVAHEFYAYETAEAYYNKVLKSPESGNFPAAQYRLGMVYKSMGQYDKARAAFDAYLQQSQTDGALREKAGREIVNCQTALDLMQKPPQYTLKRMDQKINTPYSEFGALQRNDTLYYSSFRYDLLKDKHRPGRKISKLLLSSKGGKSQPMRNDFNTDTLHIAHIAFSLDGKRLYFTRCRYVNTTQIRCELCYREKDRRKRWKVQPVVLPEPLNLKNTTTTQPAIGYDSTLQAEVLYFASDRTGGKGGMDIWRVKVEAAGFSAPENLSAVNTAANEVSPFFHQASQLLYFSSEGYANLGGFDIFNWKQGGKLENIGPPFNSSYNDLYYSAGNDGKSGYLSSNRVGAMYLDKDNKSCCLDIYAFQWIEPPPPKQGEPPVVVTTPPPSEPETPGEPPMPETLEDFLPLALYFDNDEPDKRTLRTSTKKSYEESYLKYISRKDDFLKAYTKGLQGEDRDASEEAISEFFATYVERSYIFLGRFSEILLKRLESGESVEIFIKGFTSPRAEKTYNLALGKRRISSLRNHFDTWREGIFASYLKKGQLKISERSFGEATADESISDDLVDLRNSVYSIGASRERRVEIVEVKSK